MTSSPVSPRISKVRFVVIDPKTGRVLRIIPLQYNPDSLIHTLHVQARDPTAHDESSHPLLVKGPPVESFHFEVELDATDLLERGDTTAGSLGINPLLSALELLIFPASGELHSQESVRHQEHTHAPEAPLTLFVWNNNRIVPVCITELLITEEAFDPALNPIRARVSIGMNVLSVDDFGIDHRGGSLYQRYLHTKEAMAARAPTGTPEDSGIEGFF